MCKGPMTTGSKSKLKIKKALGLADHIFQMLEQNCRAIFEKKKDMISALDPHLSFEAGDNGKEVERLVDKLVEQLKANENSLKQVQFTGAAIRCYLKNLFRTRFHSERTKARRQEKAKTHEERDALEAQHKAKGKCYSNSDRVGFDPHAHTIYSVDSNDRPGQY